MIRLLEAILNGILSLIFIAFPFYNAFSSEQPLPKLSNPSGVSHLELTGKFYCSLKRSVTLPFKGIIDSVLVQPGQMVNKGETVAIYHLSQEALQQIRRSLTSATLSNLEIKLSDTQDELKFLKAKKLEQFIFFQQQMAPMESLIQTDQEIKSLKKQAEVLSEGLREEKLLFEEHLALIQEQLGTPITPENIPHRAYLKSPISGHVIWTHPDLRNNAEMEKSELLFEIGVMNPMLFRAKVHDPEIVNLSLGAKAEISINTMPGVKFPAQLSRLDWIPLISSPDHISFYLVEFKVPNPDLFLKEGLRGNMICLNHK